MYEYILDRVCRKRYSRFMLSSIDLSWQFCNLHLYGYSRFYNKNATNIDLERAVSLRIIYYV